MQKRTVQWMKPDLCSTQNSHFTQIKMNHSELNGKRQPRFVRSSDNRKVKRRRRRGFPHWHALWTRRRRSVTQESRLSLLSTLTRSPLGIGSFSFRPGKNCGIICGLLSGFVGLISHFLYCISLLRNLSWNVATGQCPIPSIRLGSTG